MAKKKAKQISSGYSAFLKAVRKRQEAKIATFGENPPQSIRLDLRIHIKNEKDTRMLQCLADFYGVPEDAVAKLAVVRFLDEVRASLPGLAISTTK